MIPPGDYTHIPYETNIKVVLYDNKENENYPLHWHSAIEIIMPIRNNYEVYFLKGSYTLRENDILIVPPCKLHSLAVPPGAEQGERIILMFEPTLFCSLEGFSGTILALHELNMITPEGQPDFYKTAHSLIQATYEEFLQQDAFRNLAIYAKIIELYIAISRSNTNKRNFPEDSSTQDTNQEYTARLNTVFEYIENHLSEKLSLEAIAEIANLSKFHFARIFKKYTNQSFYHYLNQRRIKRTETLLLNPSLSINEVVQKAGFESTSTFYRVFKEVETCTPAEFKKMHLSLGEVTYSH
ncbi:MAG: AraC family transcriptional regulator [Treponema sp.]|jgi:AraC-like DNA-binding protein|nr:AraC family transcriptional regulator [Treponema sp.]